MRTWPRCACATPFSVFFFALSPVGVLREASMSCHLAKNHPQTNSVCPTLVGSAGLPLFVLALAEDLFNSPTAKCCTSYLVCSSQLQGPSILVIHQYTNSMDTCSHPFVGYRWSTRWKSSLARIPGTPFRDL